MNPYAQLEKDFKYGIKIPLAGHALPHCLPYSFITEENAYIWLASDEGRMIVKKIREKYRR